MPNLSSSFHFYSSTDVKIVELAKLVTITGWKPALACSTHGNNSRKRPEWTDKRNLKKKNSRAIPDWMHSCLLSFIFLSFHSHDNKQWKFTRDVLKNVINHWSTATVWLIRIKVLHSWQLVTNIFWSWRDKCIFIYLFFVLFIVYFTHLSSDITPSKPINQSNLEHLKQLFMVLC